MVKCICYFSALFILAFVAPVHAQQSKPFILPMAAPPGVDTWLFGQPYGNTIGAYIRGDQWYSAGQRLHFGLDFSMPCGTPLVAVADGEVAFVDDLGFGSGPHNLILRFPNLELTALYGHLLDRPPVTAGQTVRQGDIVGYSGDPDLTCDSRPHLHFEVRSLSYFVAYNPINYINANWHALTAVGAFRYPQFQQDLDNARRWMTIDDQPNVAFGGGALNLYAAPYPDPDAGQAPTNPPLMRDLPPPADPPLTRMRRLAFDGCCRGAWWDTTIANRIYTIDGAENQRAVMFSWDTDSEDGNLTLIGEAPPPFLSPDGTHEISYGDMQTIIQRVSDGAEWSVPNGGVRASALSADSSRLMWQVPRSAQTSFVADETEIWISDIDGANARPIIRLPNASAQWLDESRILMSVREAQTTTLYIYDTATDENFQLGAWERIRGLSVAPGGGRLMFYIAFAGEESGVYTIETLNGAAAERLNWFGAWTWRDGDSVYYLPFQPNMPYHSLRYADLISGEDQMLIDSAQTMFLVADGDWSVSPDGDQIAFMNALDNTLWLIDIG